VDPVKILSDALTQAQGDKPLTKEQRAEIMRISSFTPALQKYVDWLVRTGQDPYEFEHRMTISLLIQPRIVETNPDLTRELNRIIGQGEITDASFERLFDAVRGKLSRREQAAIEEMLRTIAILPQYAYASDEVGPDGKTKIDPNAAMIDRMVDKQVELINQRKADLAPVQKRRIWKQIASAAVGMGIMISSLLLLRSPMIADLTSQLPLPQLIIHILEVAVGLGLAYGGVSIARDRILHPEREDQAEADYGVVKLNKTET
jgi:hypothetical protein